MNEEAKGSVSAGRLVSPHPSIQFTRPHMRGTSQSCAGAGRHASLPVFGQHLISPFRWQTSHCISQPSPQKWN